MEAMQWFQDLQKQTDAAIDDFFDARYKTTPKSRAEKRFEEAMRYAVASGGKRLRAILVLLANSVCDKPKNASVNVFKAAIAVECMHAYTLVHDDMPEMDNDTMRRGKPTVWCVYGSGIALLVGDALNTLALELLCETGSIEAVRLLANAMGDLGVVRGQVKDLDFADYQDTLVNTLSVHRDKTGRFIEAAIRLGCVLSSDQGAERTERLCEYARLLGVAFQITDDLLDREGDEEKVGKTLHKDEKTDKGIIPLLGIEKTREHLRMVSEDAAAIGRELAEPRLVELIDYIVKRDK
jgi:geranylgeranyl pyrophosphate synthase